jgi:hypothetical protein
MRLAVINKIFMSDIMTQNACYTSLPNRGLIKLSGPDARAFLQKLITNNMDLLDRQPCLYACLLTPQGKFLHDFFVSEDNGAVLLECEGGPRAQDLFKRLKGYCLRDAVEISAPEDIAVYAILSSRPKAEHRSAEVERSGPPSSLARSLDFARDDSGENRDDSGENRDDSEGNRDDVVLYADPRHPDLGHRSFEKPQGLGEVPFETWDANRMRLCIPDGSRDLIPEQSTMDEARMDQLSAIDYDKGCYVGQELTARMHYRGLGKKHIYAVEGKLPASGEDIVLDDKIIGQMRSVCGDVGLALLKDEATNHLNTINIKPLTPLS